MSRKMKLLALIAFTALRAFVFAEAVQANTAYPEGADIPVRFLYDISTKDINEGDALPLEIVQDVYINGKKVFAQGSRGFAYIDELKKARWFGRSGKLRISRGQLLDVNGKQHNVFLSSSAKGDFKIGASAGALIGGAVAADGWINGIGSSATGAVLGAGLTLIPIAFLLSKGKEATISRGKVMFARLG